MAVEYRDPTPLTDEEKSDIAGIANAIRTKMYGSDVRESIATALERLSTDKANYISTPKGVADNLAALKAQFPNGNTGIYITMDDGHWHVYNYESQSWVDGGKYQTADFNLSALNMSGINILSGTSNESRTFDMTDWGATSTASNAHNLQLEKGATYIYAMDITDKPDVNIHLDVQGIKTEGSFEWHFWKHVKTTGRTFLRFTVPDNAIDHVSLNVSLNQQTEMSYSITIANEMLIRADYLYPYLPNPDDGLTNDGLNILSKIRKTNHALEYMFNHYTGLNLLNGTSQSLTVQQATGWGSISQAEFEKNGYHFNQVKPDITYTFSADVGELPDDKPNMHLIVLGFDSSGKQIYSNWGDDITAPGRYSITFRIQNKSVARLIISLSFGKEENKIYNVVYGREKLVIGNDREYSQSYDNYSTDELTTIIDNRLNQLLESNRQIDLPGINLLKGTSDKQQELKASGWGELTTSANAKTFTEFKKGATYCYRVTVTKLPQLPMALEAKGVKRGGGIKFVFHQPIDHVGDVALICTIPNVDIDAVEFSIVFTQEQKNEDSITFGSEKLSLGAFDYGYSDPIDDDANTIAESTKLIGAQLDDEPFLNSTLPIIDIQGDYQDMLNNNQPTILPFSLYARGKKTKAYAQMEWQGNSSKLWEEKNFKFKTFEKADGSGKVKWQPEPSFYKSHHFTLKSYYGDNYKMRGVAAANILSHFIANNDTAPIELLKANHFGTIQGTPILMYIQGSFYGIMQLETKSGANLWNMDDDSATNIDLEADNNTDGSNWKKVPEYGTDFQSNIDTDTNAASALKKLSDAVFVDDDDAFKTNLAKTVNVKSIADYFIFNNLINNIDAWSGKNINYLSYDNGDHWYLMPYDFDSSMLQNWRPGAVIGAGAQSINYNDLLQRAFAVFKNEIKARYRELKQLGVLNVSEMVSEIDRQVNQIGSDAYRMDQDRWPNNPSYVNKIKLEEIKYMFVLRKRLLDNMLDNGVDNQFYPLSLKEGYIRSSDGKLITVVNDPNVTTELIATNGAKSFEFKSQDVAFNNASNNSHYHYWDKDKKYIGMGNAIKSGSNPIEDSNTAYVSLSINYVDLGGKPGKWREWFAQNRYSLVFE